MNYLPATILDACRFKINWRFLCPLYILVRLTETVRMPRLGYQSPTVCPIF